MYQIGIDIGGTFTDAVLVDDEGNAWQSKVPTTPASLREGFFDALDSAITAADLPAGGAAKDLRRIMHGTTVATNVVVQQNGARVGLLTTHGFGDTLHIMQGHGYTAGIPDDEITNVQEIVKPEPIVPKALIREVTERVDSKGEIVVALQEDQAQRAIQQLLDEGAEAFAICFLWSFLNDAHERRVRELVEEMAPGTFVTTSSELAPKSGEYARTAATAINAYTGPAASRYIGGVEQLVGERGWDASLNILQCGGGVVSPAEATHSPVRLIGSGPVGGVVASRNLGQLLGEQNILATDMGGTSFDVGLIVGGEPEKRSLGVVNQYEYLVPTVDIQSIGSGGGSIVWVDELAGALRVGPESAGSDPGPACYGQGGERPTVTDCDLLWGI